MGMVLDSLFVAMMSVLSERQQQQRDQHQQHHRHHPRHARRNLHHLIRQLSINDPRSRLEKLKDVNSS